MKEKFPQGMMCNLSAYKLLRDAKYFKFIEEIMVTFHSKNGLWDVEKAIRNHKLKSPKVHVLRRKLATLCLQCGKPQANDICCVSKVTELNKMDKSLS